MGNNHGYKLNITKDYVSGGWFKIFQHDSSSGDFFSNANNWAEAKSTNVTNPNAKKYSMLDQLFRFKLNGKYTLKLVYPRLSITNIWSQTSNPVTSDGSGGVTDYQAISIGASNNSWGGLEYYSSVSDTFLDGSVGSPNWYYAVGSKSSYGGATLFPGPSASTDLVELWVKYLK